MKTNDVIAVRDHYRLFHDAWNAEAVFLIREAMLSLNVSSQELAKRMGVNHSRLNKVLRDNRKMSIPFLHHAASALGLQLTLKLESMSKSDDVSKPSN